MTEHPFTSWMRSTLDAEDQKLRDVLKARGGDHGLICPDCAVLIRGWGMGAGEPTVTLQPCGCVVHGSVVFDPLPPKPEWLALVERDRKLLELHAGQFDLSALRCSECVDFHADMDCENRPYPCPTLRLVGEFWSRLYPDSYQTEWGPE